MNAFDDLHAAAAGPSQMALFGETITYRPNGGTPREITAVVNRKPIERTGPNGLVSYRIEILVYIDDVNGIGATELDRGGDLVDVPPHPGAAAESRPIRDTIDASGGMLLLGVG